MKAYVLSACIIYCSIISACAEIIPSDIVVKFYDLLYSKERPSPQDEINFFGGKSCDALRMILSTNKHYLNYVNSKSPIWDYLRDQEYLFTTKNISDISKMRIQASDPIQSIRLYNKTKTTEKKVFVTFPSEIAKQSGSSIGISVVIFTLADDCYIDIGSTIIINGSTIVLIGHMNEIK